MVIESDARSCVGFLVGVSAFNGGVLSLVVGIDVVATVRILVGISNAESDIGTSVRGTALIRPFRSWSCRYRSS